ncbi:GNAT family N-acetyltransferase [Mitsuokella sp. WILCCON 0060]|uniref:GNAT family N-acetyltransferase n=1 Tax=Mitsuokella sp. WILCCON 0060 TaxID=3345341 RepID=UPI003F1DF4B0
MTERVYETKDYLTLTKFFHDCGMEVEPSAEVPADIQMVRMWRVDDEEGNLLAAATLEIRDGVYTLGDLGVREDHRRSGYGRRLQQIVFDEARRHGVKKLWCSGKVPKYYEKIGWHLEDWDSSPNIARNCTGCSRRNKTCFPAILTYDL